MHVSRGQFSSFFLPFLVKSGLFGVNPEHFRTHFFKKVRIRTKVWKKRTKWEHWSGQVSHHNHKKKTSLKQFGFDFILITVVETSTILIILLALINKNKICTNFEFVLIFKKLWKNTRYYKTFEFFQLFSKLVNWRIYAQILCLLQAE